MYKDENEKAAQELTEKKNYHPNAWLDVNKSRRTSEKKKKKGVTEEMETAPWLWGSVDSSWPGVQI